MKPSYKIWSFLVAASANRHGPTAPLAATFFMDFVKNDKKARFVNNIKLGQDSDEFWNELVGVIDLIFVVPARPA